MKVATSQLLGNYSVAGLFFLQPRPRLRPSKEPYAFLHFKVSAPYAFNTTADFTPILRLATSVCRRPFFNITKVMESCAKWLKV